MSNSTSHVKNIEISHIWEFPTIFNHDHKYKDLKSKWYHVFKCLITLYPICIRIMLCLDAILFFNVNVVVTGVVISGSDFEWHGPGFNSYQFLSQTGLAQPNYRGTSGYENWHKHRVNIFPLSSKSFSNLIVTNSQPPSLSLFSSFSFPLPF